MVTLRRCPLGAAAACGIMSDQERVKVMDSGGTPEKAPEKTRNRRRRFRDIRRAHQCGSIIADRERRVNPSVCRVAGILIGSQLSRFRAERPEGAMERNRNTTFIIAKASGHRGHSAPRRPLAAFYGVRLSWAGFRICAVRGRMAKRDERRPELSADGRCRSTWEHCGEIGLKGGGAAGGATA